MKISIPRLLILGGAFCIIYSGWQLGTTIVKQNHAYSEAKEVVTNAQAAESKGKSNFRRSRRMGFPRSRKRFP
ncbi:hypothetical protein CR203_06560 [Salipaludibacillus neizhouensis]|uniref:Uncharacterized protein n=1 Tax=Salipaludibacillus neizhouensis TaxID=885475 RepID=A0A3A9KC85_9BACI|nr:hypothetical protein CR203_06560 [Salipaludibacillus neizhouensis]